MDVGAETCLDKRFDKSLFPGSVNAAGTGVGPPYYSCSHKHLQRTTS